MLQYHPIYFHLSAASINNYHFMIMTHSLTINKNRQLN